MSRLTGLRTTTAYVVWWLCVLAALVLAGAATLVALRVDPGSVWGWWLEAADVVAVGWFDRPAAPAVGGQDVQAVLVRWGGGAAALLALGALVQWVVRPHRG